MVVDERSTTSPHGAGLAMFQIHNAFPKEMAVIGRLLLDYGEVELDLMNCIQVARNYDLNSTLKTMFRVRGELNRVKIADALGRVPYTAVNLEAEFSELIDAVDYCRRIRNKYAHAYWHDPDMGKALCYVSLEELAEDKQPVNDLTALTFFYIDEPLLLQQEAYFEYVRDLIRYINYEGRLRNKLIKTNIFKLPAVAPKPALYTRKG
jgi:hypothetical protein